MVGEGEGEGEGGSGAMQAGIIECVTSIWSSW